MKKASYALSVVLFLSASVQSFLGCPEATTKFSSFQRKQSSISSSSSLSASDKTNVQTTIPQVDHELQQKVKGIRAIASDVDGTLLGTDHKLSEKTKNTIRRVVQEVSKPDGNIQYFFPATGKTRKGALDSLGSEMKELLSKLPGVFIQGLYCVDGDGTVIYERKLPLRAIRAAETIATKFNITVIGNSRDEIYCNSAGDPDVLAEVNGKWGEPEPIMVDSMSESGIAFNKLVFTGKTEDIEMLRDRMRPELELLAQENEATVTTSYSTMLELLPAGCSKADGVHQLCRHLGIDPAKELLALGDQENDKGMLEMAAIGVSVGNGSPVAKAAADYIMEVTSNEGAAGLAMERFSLLLEDDKQ